MKKILTTKQILSTLLLIGILVLPYCFTFFAIVGTSMEPFFMQGDKLVIERVSLLFVPPQRGEVLVFENPHDKTQTDIKRVVGLPGETVDVKITSVDITHQDGSVETFASDTLIGGGAQGRNGLFFTMKLGSEDYFVLGDNRESSRDSRRFGAVQKADLIGRPLSIFQ